MACGSNSLAAEASADHPEVIRETAKRREAREGNNGGSSGVAVGRKHISLVNVSRSKSYRLEDGHVNWENPVIAP